MLISSASITKHHGDRCILDTISFSIEENDKIAVLGVNGTGKSTFLKIISQEEDCKGTIIRKNGCVISYLSQDPDFNENNTIMQQVYTAIDKKKVPVFEIEAMLNKLGITNYQQTIKELSGGQIKRVALAITLLTPCDLLILDEPTNHLDSSMIEYLEKYLIKYNKALLMVTHDRYFLDRITTKIFEIDHGNLYEYKANYSLFLEQKAKREEDALNTQRKRESFLRKEIEWVRAGVQARSTKSKERLARFEKLNSVEKIEDKKEVGMIGMSSRLGKKTVILDALSMSFDHQLLFTPFSYTFKRTDRIGILGNNGTGKSTLLNIIAGSIQPTSGRVILGETVKLGYFKQGNQEMNPTTKVIDYIKETSNNLITSEGSFSASQMCERFLFDSSMQHTMIGRLSGGEKRRLYLLKILMQAPNVLLFDEPTNDLDIQTLAILEDYLDSFNGVVITVCHDRYFLDRICDSIFVFKDQKITVFNGGYTMYLDTATKTSKEKGDGALRYALEKKSILKMSFKEKQELEGMENLMQELEDTISKIDLQMVALQEDFEAIAKLSTQREEVEKEVESKTERWMELLELQEKIENQINQP